MGKKVWFFDVDVTVWDLESRSTDEEEAHVGAHVQEQVKNGRLRICSTKYPVNISQRISTSSAQRLIFQR